MTDVGGGSGGGGELSAYGTTQLRIKGGGGGLKNLKGGGGKDVGSGVDIIQELDKKILDPRGNTEIHGERAAIITTQMVYFLFSIYI
jgi:hypothetical protein